MLLLRWLIKIIKTEDYYRIIEKNNKNNKSGQVELHSINSSSYLAKGLINCIWFILKRRYIEPDDAIGG